ncbi:MAG TPA: Ppx/GppA phosphatase family protein [Gaiellaceae bacterium]|nr:Ppx/GppA phosphatase family protein [Gaiellaceae bacterium]
MIRVAAIDIGTNSTRLLVADVEDGAVRELDRRLEITRLGEGVDERRILLPQAIARVRNVLADYRKAAEAAHAARTLAFATSAVRDAENGEAFLGEVEWSYGFTTRLLSGDEEALLTFRGVSAGREVAPKTLVVDVGGGSTELSLGGPEGVAFHTSLDLGCVRLTERFGREFEACAAHVRDTLAAGLPVDLRPQTAIGVAGTVTTLATLDLDLAEEDPELVHGHRLAAATVAEQTGRLEGMTVEEIRALRGMHPNRAPVITAGAVVVRETLAHFGLDELEVSEHDIMHGAALAAAELPEEAEGEAPPGAFTCC